MAPDPPVSFELLPKSIDVLKAQMQEWMLHTQVNFTRMMISLDKQVERMIMMMEDMASTLLCNLAVQEDELNMTIRDITTVRDILHMQITQMTDKQMAKLEKLMSDARDQQNNVVQERDDSDESDDSISDQTQVTLQNLCYQLEDMKVYLTSKFDKLDKLVDYNMDLCGQLHTTMREGQSNTKEAAAVDSDNLHTFYSESIIQMGEVSLQRMKDAAKMMPHSHPEATETMSEMDISMVVPSVEELVTVLTNRLDKAAKNIALVTTTLTALPFTPAVVSQDQVMEAIGPANRDVVRMEMTILDRKLQCLTDHLIQNCPGQAERQEGNASTSSPE